MSYSVTNGKLTVKGIEAFAIYNLNGMKIADVNTSTSEANVDLLPGLYIVRVLGAESFKVIVK